MLKMLKELKPCFCADACGLDCSGSFLQHVHGGFIFQR